MSAAQPFAGLIAGDLLRQDGPFELWAATAGGRRLWLRRVSKELGDAPSVRRALTFASKAAKRVAHENVILCHGMFSFGGEEVQISEHGEHLDLERLIQGAIDPREATWMIRQILDPLVHAESFELSHKNLLPRHLYAGLDGALRVDFGIMRASLPGADQTAIHGLGDSAYEPRFLPDGRSHPPPDVYAMAAIWFELLTGRRYFEALKEKRGEHPRTQLAPAIDQTLARALDGRAKDPFLDAKSFAAAVARVFYVDLDADDERHGAAALRTRVSRALELSNALQSPVEHTAVTNPSALQEPGTFTRMLDERARPVEPKPLSMDDEVSQLAEPGASTWSPGQSIPFGAGPPRTLIAPQLPPGSQPQPMPSYSGTMAPSLSAPMQPQAARVPVWVMWFLLGFVLTFLVLRFFHS